MERIRRGVTPQRGWVRVMGETGYASWGLTRNPSRLCPTVPKIIVICVIVSVTGYVHHDGIGYGLR